MAVDDARANDHLTEVERQAEKQLGFRIEVRNDGNAGAVIWSYPTDRNAVRPATSVEIRLWHTVLSLWPVGEEELSSGE